MAVYNITLCDSTIEMIKKITSGEAEKTFEEDFVGTYDETDKDYIVAKAQLDGYKQGVEDALAAVLRQGYEVM